MELAILCLCIFMCVLIIAILIHTAQIKTKYVKEFYVYRSAKFAEQTIKRLEKLGYEVVNIEPIQNGASSSYKISFVKVREVKRNGIK